MQRDAGTIASAALHAGLILWVLLGDFLFAPDEAPEIPVADVTLVSSDELAAMTEAAARAKVEEAATEEPAELPPAAETAPPTRPEPPPDETAEDLPPEVPEAEVAQPDPAPEPAPETPLADEAQPIPVPDAETPPAPQDIDRVADVPVEDVTETPELAETPTPEVNPDAVGEVVEEPPQDEASPEAATTEIVTEATEVVEDAPQLAMTSSRRPQARPRDLTEEPPPEEPAPEVPVVEDAAVEDALADVLAEATEPAPEDTAEPAPSDEGVAGGQGTEASGPPMTSGEIDGLRVSIKKCWALGAVATAAMSTIVTVRVDLAQNGTPDLGSIRMTGFEGGDEATAAVIFRTAKSAIARCGKAGFPLPPEKYDTWKDLELVFDPNGMRLR